MEAPPGQPRERRGEFGVRVYVYPRESNGRGDALPGSNGDTPVESTRSAGLEFAGTRSYHFIVTSTPSTLSIPGFRGALRDDDAARAIYSESAGPLRIMPRGVAVPVDQDDLAHLCAWASAHDVTLTPRGSG